MRVNVAWSDIREGKARSTTECMVASALKRQLGIAYASVGLRDVRVRIDGRYVTLRLPKEVSRKIRFWELFHFVFPFSFEVPWLTVGLRPAGAAACDRESLQEAAIARKAAAAIGAC